MSDAFITETTIEPTGEGPLDGRTVAVKDNLSTAGVRTTCGSRMLESYVPPYDATVVSRLSAAGAVIVGKANMDEFGMGTTTETSYFGPTENPAAPGRVPGGSSGGSAAAVAAGDAELALGSDTGGSIRCPAAFCDVVGIKPTYGLVSRYGLIAYANSLEQVGPIASTVADAATLLDVIAGPDERDATTRADPGTGDYVEAADGDVDGVTVGVPDQLLEGAQDVVRERFWDAMDDLESRGVTIERVDLPSIAHAVAAYYVIAMSEASSNLARYDGVRYGPPVDRSGNWNDVFSRVREAGFGEEVTRRILLGTYALSAGYHEKYYAQAQDARAWIKQDFDEALSRVDALASPTMPVVPFERGDGIDDPLTLYQADANTVPVNLADLPAISVPADGSSGLPVGVQFIGPAFGERIVIRLGSALA